MICKVKICPKLKTALSFPLVTELARCAEFSFIILQDACSLSSIEHKFIFFGSSFSTLPYRTTSDGNESMHPCNVTDEVPCHKMELFKLRLNFELQNHISKLCRYSCGDCHLTKWWTVRLWIWDRKNKANQYKWFMSRKMHICQYIAFIHSAYTTHMLQPI